jgi:hypothetical protein
MLIVRKYLNNRKAAIISAILVLVVFYLSILAYNEKFYNNVFMYLIAYELILMLTIVSQSKNDEDNHKYIILSIAVLSCTTFLGSNTGVVKFISLPVIPILFIYITTHRTGVFITFSWLTMIALTLYFYNGYRHHSFGDVGSIEATCKMQSPLLRGIKTTAEKSYIANLVERDIKQYQGYNKLILRQGWDYIYEYMYLTRNGYLRHRFQDTDDNDETYVKYIQSEIKAEGKYVILYFKNKKTDESTLVERFLDDNYNKAIIRNEYTIYLNN